MYQSLKQFAILDLLLLLLLLPTCISGSTSVLSKSNHLENGIQLQSQTEQKLVSIRQIFGDIEELIRSIAQTYASYGPQITADFKELLSKITNRITNALDKFKFGLLDASGLVLREGVRNLEEQLIRLKEEFQSLANIADKEFHDLIDYLNNTLINHTENIVWVNNLKQELRTANKSRLYKDGCKVVDALMHQTTDELRNCCNIAMKPVYSLCRSVREVLIESLRVFADALERIQTCVEDKNSYLEYMMPCVNVAYDDIGVLVKRATQLRKRLTMMLPMKIVFSKFCILVVSVQTEQRQQKVEHTINANQSNTNTV